MSKQKIVFIVNPNSGTDRTKASFLKNLDAFRSYSPFDVLLEYTARAGHAKEIVNGHLQNGIGHFVAVGGDGTVNEVASQLLEKDAVLYIIPKGSGNGLARHLKIPMEEAAALRRIAGARVREIDCGFINGIPFLCTSGIGFDAYSAALFSGSKKRGFMSYVLTGLTGYWKYQPVKLVFQDRSAQIFSLTFANADQFGNNALIAPKATIDDGFLDCMLINPHPSVAALGLIRSMFKGNLDQSGYTEYYRAKEFKVETERAPLIHFDGEPFQLEVNHIEVTIKEKVLKVGI